MYVSENCGFFFRKLSASNLYFILGVRRRLHYEHVKRITFSRKNKESDCNWNDSVWCCLSYRAIQHVSGQNPIFFKISEKWIFREKVNMVLSIDTSDEYLSRNKSRKLTLNFFNLDFFYSFILIFLEKSNPLNLFMFQSTPDTRNKLQIARTQFLKKKFRKVQKRTFWAMWSSFLCPDEQKHSQTISDSRPGQDY